MNLKSFIAKVGHPAKLRGVLLLIIAILVLAVSIAVVFFTLKSNSRGVVSYQTAIDTVNDYLEFVQGNCPGASNGVQVYIRERNESRNQSTNAMVDENNIYLFSDRITSDHRIKDEGLDNLVRQTVADQMGLLCLGDNSSPFNPTEESLVLNGYSITEVRGFNLLGQQPGSPELVEVVQCNESFAAYIAAKFIEYRSLRNNENAVYMVLEQDHNMWWNMNVLFGDDYKSVYQGYLDNDIDFLLDSLSQNEISVQNRNGDYEELRAICQFHP